MTLLSALTTTEQIAPARRAGAAATLGLLLLSFTANVSALSGWWLSDDPQVLVQADRYSPREYFFVPEVWRYLSSSNFTPLVTLSFEADLALAGLNPRAFYLHQLIAITLAAILLYFFLATYTGRLLAFASAAMFLLSPQAIVAARTLMVRHYVEGLVFALIGLLTWRAGRIRKRPVAFGLLAAAAYLLAVLAKEVYLGIPLIMLLESFGAKERPRNTILRLLPVIAAAVGYGVWRFQMLDAVGGYGDRLRLSDLIRLGSLALGPVPPSLQMIFGSAIVTLLVVAALNQPRGTVLFCGITLLVVLPPLLAVGRQLELRHLFAGFVVVTAGVGMAVRATRRGKGLASAAAGAALVATVIAGQMVRQLHEEGSRQVVAEGRYVWSRPASSPAVLATAPGWYLDGLAELRSRHGLGEAPRVVLSREGLLVEEIDPRRVVIATNGVKPLDQALIDQIRTQKQRFDPKAPLAVFIERHENRLRWELGPQPSSNWTFITYPDYDDYQIPASGTRIIPESDERQFFRILRHLPDGTWTVSPPLAVPGKGQSVRWQR